MKFTLTIDTDNAAFSEVTSGPGLEVARILRDVAGRVEGIDYGVSGLCSDINGNTVGAWEWKVRNYPKSSFGALWDALRTEYGRGTQAGYTLAEIAAVFPDAARASVGGV